MAAQVHAARKRRVRREHGARKPAHARRLERRRVWKTPRLAGNEKRKGHHTD